MKRQDALDLIAKYKSPAFAKNRDKIINKMAKLYKNSSDYVAFRDLLLFAVSVIMACDGSLSTLKTTLNGHKEMQEMLSIILEDFDDNPEEKEPA